MEINLLHDHDTKLSPEARWLLLQWSASAGLQNAIASPRLELYRQLGMTHQHARAALEELKKRGVVIEEKVRQRRGRPITRFRISSDSRTYLKTLETGLPHPHRPEIESLLEQCITARIPRAGHSQNLMTGKERANKIAPATYWLLAVLLAHARTPGVVTGLGLKQLVALTGMKREKLRAQLAKLKKLEVISRSVPGASRDQGTKRLQSVYVLNLSHPILMGQKSLALTALLVPVGGVSGYNFISGALQAAALKAKLVKHQSQVIERIEDAFTPGGHWSPAITPWLRSKGEPSLLWAISNYHQDAQSLLPPISLTQEQAASLIRLMQLGIEASLHAHLLGYAMTLLSNHWNEIRTAQELISEPIKPVLSAIEKDCSSLITTEISSRNLSTDIYTSLYQLAVHIAKEIQLHLRKIDKDNRCDFSKPFFLIEPFRQGRATRWSIKVHFRNPADSPYTRPLRRICWIPSVKLSLPPLLRALPPEITRELN